MSQCNVEHVIGRLVTDEGLRRRFAADPCAVVQELLDGGLHLNPCELQALAAIDPSRLDRFAAALDPRIQKVELSPPDEVPDCDADPEIDPAGPGGPRSGR